MRTVFHGGEVFDGTGAPPRRDDIAVEDGRIVAIGEHLSGDEHIDCTGRTLLPGLFDCHIHLAYDMDDFDPRKLLDLTQSEMVLRFPGAALTTLRLGITTVRDAAGADLGMKRAVANRTVVGPRMQISVSMLSMTGGHADDLTASGVHLWGEPLPTVPSGLCDGVDDCIRTTREMIRAGADVIKVSASGGFLSEHDDPEHPNFLQEELDAIVRTAADLGRPVMAHAHGAEPIKRAIRAGVRSIEHGTYLDDEAIDMMITNGTWLVPTLTAGDTTEQMASDPALPEAVRRKFEGLGRPELESFRRAAEAGVKVAMGTDCPVAPHGTNLRELILMTEGGYSPTQALVAATAHAAELMGLDPDLGTLEEGKIADVVVVDGDPFDFDTLPDRIEQVWKDGARVV